MKFFALSQRSGETYDAAGKAMHDVFTILAQKGCKTIWSMPKSCSKYMKILDLPYLAVFLLLNAGKKDSIFYSIPENHIKIKLLKKMQKIKKYNIICFINDLNAFRYGNANDPIVQQKMKEEAKIIGVADFVLMPNVNTGELLRKNGVTSTLIPVGVWDYLMSEEQGRALREHQEKSCPPVKIAFAGNLNKSEFLKYMKLPADGSIELHLWGKLEENRKKDLPAHSFYHGVLPADEVPQAVSSMDYGLVWDGTGKDAIEGGLGEYLKYNNSHKCGLYLASGIPAIVWKHSGMAHFVEEHHCGITIGCLSELEEAIQAAPYKSIRENAGKVSGELQQGYYLSRALDEALAAGK